MIIQIVIAIIALGILFFTLVGRQTYAARAWKKIALCALAFAMIIVVIFPGIITSLANLIGIGRGSDLLLYVLVFSFIGYVLNNYIHQQRDKDTVYRLARKIALLEASGHYKLPKR